MEAIFTPRAEKLCCQIELSETLELAIYLPNEKKENREEEFSHSEQPVHKNFTIPATDYFDWDYARAE